MENNKIYRNLQEQVLFNSQELKALKQLQANGLEIKGLVATASELPEVVNGEAYLVGTEKPYQLYVAIGGSYYNLGAFPAPGPKGEKGIQGQTGLEGERGTQWTIGTLLPESAKTGDLHVNFEGKVWKYDGAQWQYALSIRGPQGLLGSPGEKGETGEKGEQGEPGPMGLAGSAVRIIARLFDLDQLPDPDLVSRDSAYIVNGKLYIIVGDEVLTWYEAGPFISSLIAGSVAFNQTGTGLVGANVQAALADAGSKIAGKVDKTIKVNGKALSGDIKLAAADIDYEEGGNTVEDALYILETYAAKKNVNNNFTVAQSIPSGTLPQHAVNLSQLNANEIMYQGSGSDQILEDTIYDIKSDINWLDERKADKLVLTNYAKNGNMSSTTDYDTYGGTLSANANILTLTSGNVTTAPSARQDTNAVLSDGSKLYITIKVKHTNKQPTAFEMAAYGNSPLALIKTMAVSNPTMNSEYFMSMIAEPTTQTTNLRVLLNPKYTDIITAENSITQFRELIVVNLTATFGAGNEPTKEQMDAIINHYGYFQQLTMNLKDIFTLIQTRAQRYTPTLLGGATSGNLFYTKDQNGFVDFSGRVEVDLGGNTSLDICALPLGFRPMNSTMYSSILDNGEHVRVYIDYLGNVRVYKTGTINLAIRFPVA